MKIDYKTINTKDVDTLITSAIKSAGKMKEAVQIAAVSVLMHAAKHGDYSKAQVLVDGLGDGVHGGALVAWFQKYGGLLIDSESGEGFNGWSGAEYIRDKFSEAKEVHWYTLKKQNPYRGFDLSEALATLLKRAELAEKARKDALAANDMDKANKIHVDSNLLGKLKAIA